MILEIPASQETPQFAMKDDALRAPPRYGAQTVFMSERDIEQAYRIEAGSGVPSLVARRRRTLAP